MTTKRLFAGAAMMILLIFVIATINWIGVQQERMNSLQTDIYNIKNELSNQISNEVSIMKQEIFDELNRQSSNVFDASYIVNDYSKEENCAFVSVKFALKEYNPANPVTLVISRENEVQSVVTEYDNGIFKADIKLTLNDNDSPYYTYALSYRTGGETVTSGEILELSPGDDLRGRITGNSGFSASEHYSDSTGKATVNFHLGFENAFGTNEKLKIVSAVFYVTLDGNVVKTIDLSDKIIEEGGCQYLKSEETISHQFDAENQEILGAYSGYFILIDAYGFEYGR